MLALVAALPVAAVLVLMLAARWSAARAGVVSAVLALVLAVTVFGFGGDDDPFTVPQGLAGVLAEALFVALTVLLIIGPALAIHQLQVRTGATDRLRDALSTLSPDPRVAALLIAWFFSLFVEGAAGFGTPVALAAPFLVAMGFRPVGAVAAALIGHAAGVSFGSVGTPISAQSGITGIPGSELAAATAPYLLVLGGILAAAVVVIIGRATPTVGSPWRWGALAAVLFFVPYGLIARFVGPELPTLAGSLLGAAGFVAVLLVGRRKVYGRRRGYARPELGSGSGSTMSVWAAGSPYLFLVVAVLVTRLVPSIRDGLKGVRIEWEYLGEFTGSMTPLSHPGVLLIAAFIVGAIAQRARRPVVGPAARDAVKQLGIVSVALVAMITIAVAMSGSGMTSELANAAAGTGAAWPFFAPAIGALGAFITGSTTSSNILFADFQLEAANEVGASATALQGAQGYGAGVGTIVSPYKIIAAAAVVDLTGKEGRVLRITLPIALVCVALGGLLALWWA